MSDVISYSYEELSTLFKTQKYIAVDTETTGLHWWRTEVCVVSFAWAGGSTALWIPVEERRPNSPMARLLTELFKCPSNRVIFWNAKFDFHQIRNTFGVESSSWDSFHDAMIMCHLLDENRRMALKVRVKEDLGIDPIEEKQLKLHMRRNKLTTYDEIPLDILLPYAVRDAEFTLMFYAKYFSDVREYFLEVYDLERKVLMVLMEMERHGVLIDKPYLEGVQEQLLTDLDELDISIKNLIGDELNINSPKQLADFFFRKEGLAPVKMGKTHESVDVSVLEQLKHPLAEQLVSYRKKFKLANTYVAPMLEMLDDKGRLHCSYNQVGAKTGRMSCSDPNLQNIPSDRETLLIRRAFVSDSGMVFFDYSGMEARVFAHYCNDTKLINTYTDNLDPYIMVGASIFNIPYEDVVAKLEAGDSEAKNMRYIGKTTFLSTIYGVGKKKLSRELSVSMDEAESFLKSFFKLYPKIKPFIRTTSDQVKVNGHIATLAGRYRRLEFKDNYKAVNSLIQGTATGDMLKASLIKSHEALRETGGSLSLVIHDEVAVEGLPHEAIPVIKSILEDFDFKVPIPVDVSVSEYSWADKKKFVKDNIQSRRKPFNVNTYASHDDSGKQTVLKLLSQLGIEAEENPDRYGVDILGKSVDNIWEVEKRPLWVDEWPFSTVHIPNRKEKFLHPSMIYSVVNRDLNKVMFCSSTIISGCEQVEVPNKEVESGEYFYDVPLSEWQVYNVEEEENG